jgi:hypothetical protein
MLDFLIHAPTPCREAWSQAKAVAQAASGCRCRNGRDRGARPDRQGCGDITQVSALLATVEGRIASVIADGAYDGEAVYRAATARQHDPPVEIVIPPRSSSVVTTKTDCNSTRDRHVQLIAEKGRMAWQKATGYGRRSLVEKAIGCYKHIIASALRARSDDGQGG